MEKKKTFILGFILHPEKEDFLEHINTGFKLGFHSHSLVQWDNVTCGAEDHPPSSDQCS